MERFVPMGRPAIAALVAATAGVWMIFGPTLGHMGPPWPCVFAGVVILICAAASLKWPSRHRGCGLMMIIVGGGVLLLGRGGIVPGGIGIIAGILTVVWGGARPGYQIE